MKFYSLEAEVAGGLGENSIIDSTYHPPRVSRLHYEFDGWLGDDLLQSFPCYIVAERAKKALNILSPTGCMFDSVEVSKSEIFTELQPDQELPGFFWLKITGRAGEDDFGISEGKRHLLVVSERVLRCLQAFNLNHCEINEYRAGSGRTI